MGDNEKKRPSEELVQDAEASNNSRTRSGSAASIESTPSESTSALKNYLKIGASIDTVNLPIRTNDGYSALAVDAASGTGKTQQALAFLAKGKEIVYMLCSSSAMTGSQFIYSAMSTEVSAMNILL